MPRETAIKRTNLKYHSVLKKKNISTTSRFCKTDDLTIFVASKVEFFFYQTKFKKTIYLLQFDIKNLFRNIL